MGEGRTTLSFYRYVGILEPEAMVARLREGWQGLGVLGRIYVAKEGVNAQLSLPTERLGEFRAQLEGVFPGVALKVALAEPGEAFRKLTVKVRAKLVGDGIDEAGFDASDVGRHLTAAEFHQAMDLPGTVVVDMRNHYECEVGHFDRALLPEANTFKEALPEVRQRLAGQEEAKILLYCTGGIRCEKASAWLKYQGFTDVNQLHGGIIDYARQLQQSGEAPRFRGKNFVFDERRGERVTEDIIGRCHQCESAADSHVNCRFEGCNRLFLQCAGCGERFHGCCSDECKDYQGRPKAERVAIQHAAEQRHGKQSYWSRTRVKVAQVAADKT